MTTASLSALVMPLCVSDWDMVVAVLTGYLNSNAKITTTEQLDLLLSCCTSIHLISQPWMRRQVLLLVTCILVRSGLVGVPAALEEYLMRSWDDCEFGATFTFDDARFLVCLAHRGRGSEPLVCRILRSSRVGATFLSAVHLHTTLEMVLDIMLASGWSHGSYRRPCGMCALLQCFDSSAPSEALVVDTALQLIQACVRSGRMNQMEKCLRERSMDPKAAEIPMMCFIGALRKRQDCKWLRGRLSSRHYSPIVTGVIVSLYGSDQQLGLESVDELLYCATEGCFPVNTSKVHIYVSRHSPMVAATLGKVLKASSDQVGVAGRALLAIQRHARQWSSLGWSRDQRVRWLGEGFYMVVCVVFRDLIGLVSPEAVLETVLLLNSFRLETADSEALVSTALAKVEEGKLAALILPLQKTDEVVTGLSWLGQKASEVCNKMCLPLLYRGLNSTSAVVEALMAVAAGGLPVRDRIGYVSRAVEVHTAEHCGPLGLAVCRLMEAADTDAYLAERILKLLRDATLRCSEPSKVASLYEVFLRAGRRWTSLAADLLYVPVGIDAEGIFRKVVTSEYDYVSKRMMFLQWIQQVRPMRLTSSL